MEIQLLISLVMGDHQLNCELDGRSSIVNHHLMAKLGMVSQYSFMDMEARIVLTLRQTNLEVENPPVLAGLYTRSIWRLCPDVSRRPEGKMCQETHYRCRSHIQSPTGFPVAPRAQTSGALTIGPWWEIDLLERLVWITNDKRFPGRLFQKNMGVTCWWIHIIILSNTWNWSMRINHC